MLPLLGTKKRLPDIHGGNALRNSHIDSLRLRLRSESGDLAVGFDGIKAEEFPRSLHRYQDTSRSSCKVQLKHFEYSLSSRPATSTLSKMGFARRVKKSCRSVRVLCAVLLLGCLSPEVGALPTLQGVRSSAVTYNTANNNTNTNTTTANPVLLERRGREVGEPCHGNSYCQSYECVAQVCLDYSPSKSCRDNYFHLLTLVAIGHGQRFVGDTENVYDGGKPRPKFCPNWKDWDEYSSGKNGTHQCGTF